VVTCTSGFSASIAAFALSTFGVPSVFSECAICRWRFDSSTMSASTIPMWPTPAAARYSAAGEPRPPAPSRRIFDSRSLICPSSPISGIRRWRE
jgi:hypothetical protein